MTGRVAEHDAFVIPACRDRQAPASVYFVREHRRRAAGTSTLSPKLPSADDVKHEMAQGLTKTWRIPYQRARDVRVAQKAQKH